MTETLPVRAMGPCPVCGQSLSKPISSCASCHTPHHAECWEYNEGCSIFGCGVKPAPPEPPPPSLMARVLPRVSVTLLLFALFGLFALGGRRVSVRVDDLSIDAKGTVTTASWMTTPRSACVMEVVRAEDPDVVLYRRHTTRSHHHRLELPFIKAGETYLVRVMSQGGWGHGETISQLYRAPDPAPLPAAFDKFLKTVATANAAIPRAPTFTRDPFQMPFGGLTTRVRPLDPRSVWTSFDMKLGQQAGQISWRTRTPVLFCRVLLMRDSTLKGVEKVVDATSRVGGHFHRVSLDGLEPDTSYQMLVLGFPETGDPIQSPVVSFRTMP